MGDQNELKYFRAKFVKRPQTRLVKTFSANLNALNSKTFIDKVPNHTEDSSYVSLKYTIVTNTGMSKKTLGTRLLVIEKYIFI